MNTALEHPTTALSRREFWIVVICLAVGFGIRIAWPGSIAVEHFDEGVYASNLWFGAEAGYHYPMRHLYAPPLLPAMIETSLVLDQATSATPIPRLATPMWPALLAGVTTILLVWVVARSWFGSQVALATLVIATTSDFHTLYSRTALTDGLLITFLIASVYLFQRGVHERRFLLLLAAGVTCGLAWWTKYNGWLPLAIVGAAGGIVVLFVTPRTEAVAFFATRWVLTAIVAAVVFLPYVLSLETVGGYSSVASNHAQYLVGWTGWWDGLLQQADNISWWDSGLTLSGLLLATCLAGGERVPQSRSWQVLTLGLALLGAAMWLGSAIVLGAVAALGLFMKMRQHHRLSGWSTHQIPGIAIVVAWFVALFVATPLYYPYPRLTLPWLCGAWFAAALGMRAANTVVLARPKWVSVVIGLAGTCAVLAAIPLWQNRDWLNRDWQNRVSAWQPRLGLVTVASEMIEALQPSQDAIFLVHGEPGLFYQLRAQGIANVLPIADLMVLEQLTSAPVDIYLVAGPHAQRSTSYQAQLDQAGPRLKLVETFPYLASDLVLLNQSSPATLRSSGREMWSVKVYELQP